MKRSIVIRYILPCLLLWIVNISLTTAQIVIENAQARLVIGNSGEALSLIHKYTGQECLVQGTETTLFSLTQDRPYDNELQLAFPAKPKTFLPDSVYRVGDDLIVSFELVNYVATISLKITDDYIGFTLEKLEYFKEGLRKKRKTRIDEFVFLQLPVRDRTHFGEWLNVMWDDDIAVNILATDHYARIDAFKRNGYHILQAGTEAEVKIEGTGAALITTSRKNLMDCIDRVEENFNLPRGVKSRWSEEYRWSYYETRNVTPQNIDEHIAYAKLGGFRTMVIYYHDFAKMGHFPWRPQFPNGMADLKAITDKIKEAGIIPGFHIHYSKAQKDDLYVSPKPDNRLNLRRIFTLAAPLDEKSTTITVEESPEGCTMEDNRRFLKIGYELITYETYTTTPPYQFSGCKRGELNTLPESREAGYLFGLLDVDTWPLFVRFNQKTSIQKEVAERIGKLYTDAGFQFVYFDGAEDVPPPYWFNVSRAQLVVYNALKPAPLFSEGAVKSHFSWHILTRGNAFDIFKPELVKMATRKHPAAEAQSLVKDFSSLNFGWIDYLSPGENTIGMQPDMYEYITSRAAGWDCPVSLLGRLDQLQLHPRTPDNLEVFRRWEEVRAGNWLSDEQKMDLRNLDQEHILLINETGNFELLPYDQIKEVAEGNNTIRAFIFERQGAVYVVYWHISGKGTIELNVDPDKTELFEELGHEIPVHHSKRGITLPAGKRRYLKFELPREEVMDIFREARLVSSESVMSQQTADSGYPPEIPGARAETYKTVDDIDLKLWIFSPEDHHENHNRPAIVFFFGGGWKSGSPSHFVRHCEYLANRGMVAIVADYRVHSRNGVNVNSCVEDAKSAMRWIRKESARLGIDPDRIVAGGGSAGGHLAAATATLPEHNDPNDDLAISVRPNALVLFNPALIIGPVSGQDESTTEALSEVSTRLGAEPASLSPYHHIKSGISPTIIFHGTDDTTVPFKHAELFCDKMLEQDNHCELVGYIGSEHGFFNFGRDGNASFIDTIKKMDAFLVSLGYLKGAPETVLY
ncbi:MAG: alpha/beta hydrolase fold domain-containing protein [Bacteroidales bacterium]|nr:alpha/beta hydrolase fold domain-containing protein [Bacteroidales bacterium]